MKRADILKYVKNKYNVEAEYPWEDYPEDAVLRHINGRKWFGVILSVRPEILGLESKSAKVDVINLKLDPLWVSELTAEPEIFPAYHMNKTHWISVLLGGKFPKDRLECLIDNSYELTLPKSKRVKK